MNGKPSVAVAITHETPGYTEGGPGRRTSTLIHTDSLDSAFDDFRRLNPGEVINSMKVMRDSTNEHVEERFVDPGWPT